VNADPPASIYIVLQFWNDYACQRSRIVYYG
jgi:hypothetical protein